MAINVYERLGELGDGKADFHVLLDYEQRDRGRLRLTSLEGDEIHVFLERGRPLQIGEFLRSDCGRLIKIAGAEEPVTRAECSEWPLFALACYHLGNRHVRIEVGDCWLKIKPDHVLEQMLQHLGLTTTEEQAIFNPESGAYSHGHHSHA